MTGAAGTSAAAGDHDAVLEAARAGEPDRYLAALLAPVPARDALLALAAFSAELARIPQAATREPLMGEIRLQWWRDALETKDGGARTGHPVADAVRDAVARHALPAALLHGMIDAYTTQLVGEPLPDERTLSAYLWQTEGALFALAARVLGAAPCAIDGAAADCGQAYGAARLLWALPRSLARDARSPLPLTAQDLAGDSQLRAAVAARSAEIRRSFSSGRQKVAKLPRSVRVAFLPLALVGPYLRTLERAGDRFLREEPTLAPLTRIGRIAAAHWLGWM